MRFEELRVNMAVRVGPKMDYDQGWGTTWIAQMDGMVGHVYLIKQIDGVEGAPLRGSSHGVLLKPSPNHPEAPEPAHAWFPWHNLEDAGFTVVDALSELCDQSLHGPNQYDRVHLRYSWWLRSPFNGESVVADDKRTSAERARVHRARFQRWKERKARALSSLAFRMEMASPTPQWRYADTPDWEMASIFATKRRVHDTLVELRSACPPSAEAVATLLAECETQFSVETARLIFGAFKRAHPQLRVSSCGVCGSWHVIPETNSVVDGLRVCPSCFEERYLYSEVEGRAIQRATALQFFETAEQWANRDTGFYVEQWVSSAFAEGRYPRHPQTRRFVFSQEAFAAVFRNGRELNGNIDNYHGAARNFVEVVTAGSPWPALGVELEVECADQSISEDDSAPDANRRERSRAVLAVRKLPEDFICERDGSLSDSRGFEIVTRPYGKQEWPRVAEMLLTTLREHNVVGYDTTGYNRDAGEKLRYGIHVNIHRRHLSSLQEARMLMFMAATENANFVRAIAQRQHLYGNPEVDMGTVVRPKVRTFGGLFDKETYDSVTGLSTYERKVRGLGKYSAINLKNDVAEFRIFQSTTYLPSFMKNLEFVWALVEWTSTAAATGKSWHHRDFVEWLSKRGGARADYPHLMDYLRRESYTVKQGKGRIENTWADLLRGTVEGEIDEAASEVQASAVVIPLRRVIEKAVVQAELQFAMAG